ncbi:MAG: hypothetical protein ABJB61_06710 [bacterium]
MPDYDFPRQDAKMLLGESKSFFMRKAWWVRHLEAFCEFQKVFPVLVVPEEDKNFE